MFLNSKIPGNRKLYEIINLIFSFLFFFSIYHSPRSHITLVENLKMWAHFISIEILLVTMYGCGYLFDIMIYLTNWYIWHNDMFDGLMRLMNWYVWHNDVFNVMICLMDWYVWHNDMFNVMMFNVMICLM